MRAFWDYSFANYVRSAFLESGRHAIDQAAAQHLFQDESLPSDLRNVVHRVSLCPIRKYQLFFLADINDELCNTSIVEKCWNLVQSLEFEKFAGGYGAVQKTNLVELEKCCRTCKVSFDTATSPPNVGKFPQIWHNLAGSRRRRTPPGTPQPTRPMRPTRRTRPSTTPPRSPRPDFHITI